MYQKEYYVLKESGTYSNVLEAFGLATLLNYLLDDETSSVRIFDSHTHYVIKLSRMITKEIIERKRYKELFPYIKYKDDKPPADTTYIDYDAQKTISDNQKLFEKKKYQELAKTSDKEGKLRIRKMIQSYEPKRHYYWDLFSNINKLKALHSYKKIYWNIKNNEQHFNEIIKAILLLYSIIDDQTKIVDALLKRTVRENVLSELENVNTLQLFNPHQGKGVNALKANSNFLGQESAFWLREYLKIVGCYKSMFIRPIQVNSKTWDTKIYVIDPKDIDYEFTQRIYQEFRPTLKGTSSYKLDIGGILMFCKVFINNIEEYRQHRPFLRFYNPNRFINGFYTAYLKKLGTSEAVSNLSFLQLPIFIEIRSKNDCDAWISILNDHIVLITGKSIIESGTGLEILQLYRQFITTSDFESFLNMLCLYGEYLMQELSKEHYYVYPFSKRYLEKFFELTKEYFMPITNKPIAPILKVEGFQNLAKAIRNSTISLQYTPKGNRIYEVRYGLAQDLKRKSAYKNELIEYLSEFETSYNNENARVKERKGEQFITRATIKKQDIEEVISLIDEYGSNIVGKLLVAYGYALDRKEKVGEETETLETVSEE